MIEHFTNLKFFFLLLCIHFELPQYFWFKNRKILNCSDHKYFFYVTAKENVVVEREIILFFQNKIILFFLDKILPVTLQTEPSCATRISPGFYITLSVFLFIHKLGVFKWLFCKNVNIF